MLTATRIYPWLVWRQHGGPLLTLFGALMVVALVSAVAPATCTPEQGLLFGGILIALTLSPSAIYLLSLFTYGPDSIDLLARESCFPPRLYRLPITTTALVAGPLLYGAIFAILLWLATAWLLLRPWLEVVAKEPALWWPALFMAATLAWVQALVWLPFGLRWLRIALLVMLFPVINMLAVGSVVSEADEGFLIALYAGLMFVGWGLSYVGVQRARSGNTPDWEWTLEPLRQWARRRPIHQHAFASALHAQTWFERRLTGMGLPFSTVLLLPLVLFPLHFGKNDALPVAQTLGSALALPVLLAAYAGGWGGNGRSHWARDRARIAPFLATLPLTNAAMVAAMLRAAVRTTLTTWAIVALSVPVAVVATGNLAEVATDWRKLTQGLPPWKIAVGSFAVITWLLVWTWKRKVDALYLGLTGRRWVDTNLVGVSIPGSLALLYLASWIKRHPETHETVFAVLPWLLGVVILWRLLVAGWALRRGLQRGLLDAQTVRRALASWLLLALVLCGALAWAIPGEWLPWYYLVYAVLFALPMARLSAAPLALAWNRHR